MYQPKKCKGFPKHLVFRFKERCSPSAIYKFGKAESAHYIRTLQNGRTIPFETDPSKRGLYVQNRSKRCLFFSLASSRFSKVCKVQLKRPHLRVSVPMFGHGPSTKDFYKTNENSNISVEEVEYTPDNIFGQNSDYGILSGRNSTSMRHFDIPSTRFESFNEFKKIIARAISDFTFPSCGNKFQRNDLNSLTGQER